MRLILVLFFVSVGLLPSVPILFSAPAIFFLAMLLILGVAVIYENDFKVKFDGMTLLIFFFLFLLLPINFLVGLSNGVSAGDIGRGVVPFLFLSTYFVFNQLPDAYKDQLLIYFWLAAGIWASSIIVFNLPEFLASLRGDLLRLTFEVNAMLIPFGLIGLAISLYYESLPKTWRRASAFVFCLLILTSGYRSQLALAAMMFLFRYRNIFSIRSIFPLFLLMSSLGLYAVLNPAFVEMMITRFVYSLGDDVRSLEVDFAMSVFSQSPLLGGGLGYPIPVQEVRPESLHDIFDKRHVSYIHNFLAYALMCFGLVGTLLIAAIFLHPILRNIKSLFSMKYKQKQAAIISLLVLLPYFQVSASFRQIQMWIVISGLLVILQPRKLEQHV
jgi:hypothetical protein